MSSANPLDLSEAKVLIVDDVAANLTILSEALEPAGYEIFAARSGQAALESAQRILPDLILLDVMMPDMDGFETCRRLKADERTRTVPVIFVTARNDTASVVEGFRAGAVDYLTKPVQTEEVIIRVQTHLKIHFLTRELDRRNQDLDAKNQELQRKNEQLAAEMQQRQKAEQKASLLSQREAERWSLASFIGASPACRKVAEDIGKMQRFSSTNVLIAGESGTGKELIARAIHYGGSRLEGPFVPVNCSAIPKDLAESAFFGHVKGAFSGATADHKGYFEQAHDGTLFLDEIGDMPLELQSKLLRVLEDGIVVPVGGVKDRRFNVRILAGTNVDLLNDLDTGRFRQDLYFRLAAFTMDVPPLRERREDIPLLANHFLQRFATEMGMAGARLRAAALESLNQYDYPGNVRELKNLIERSLIESGGEEIGPEHLYFCGRLKAGVGARTATELTPPAEPLSNSNVTPGSHEDRLLQHVKASGSINNTQCRDLLGVGLHRACYLLRKLHRAGLLEKDRSRKAAQYRLPLLSSP